MKATKYINTILAATMMALPSCSECDDVAGGSGGGVALEVSADIEGADTRAYDDTWEAGNCIGISGSNESITYTNKKYKYDSDTSSTSGDFSYAGTGQQIILKSQATNFSAYYPYRGSEGTYPYIPVSTSGQSLTLRKSFDFLFGTATASAAQPNAKFAFKHKMTRLILKIGTDDNSWYSKTGIMDNQKTEIRKLFDGATYKLEGIKHNGTFDITTGVAKVNDNSSASVETLTAIDTEENNSPNFTYYKKFDLILIPQSGSTVKINVTIEGHTYKCEIKPALAAGTSYTYTITANVKTGLEVSPCNIAQWTPASQSGSGTAEYTDPFNGHKDWAVYMGEYKGKKIYFADRNIGADSPDDPGLYFWWGDVVGHEAGDQDFNFDSANCITSDKTTQQLYDARIFTTNDYNTGVLTPEYDAAHVQWGGRWRMPTSDEWEWLIKTDYSGNYLNCTWKWQESSESEYKRAGHKVTNPSTSESIFLPTTGYRMWTSFSDTQNAYHVSNLSSTAASANKASIWVIRNSGVGGAINSNYDRYRGYPIRPVIVL